jgi:hypothetical protein
METYPTSLQRVSLLQFAKACCTRSDKLRRDECGDWTISGKYGHIFAVPEGFQLMIFKTARGWSEAKRRIHFGVVTQDGDEEGSVILSRLPSFDEALAIRHVLGIPKHKELSEESITILRERINGINAQKARRNGLEADPGSVGAKP